MGMNRGTAPIAEDRHPRKVTVALVGVEGGDYERPAENWDRLADLPYESRPSVEIEASAGSTLGEILAQAEMRFGITPKLQGVGGRSPFFVSFYLPRADALATPDHRLMFMQEIPLLDANGRAVWGQDFRTASLGQVQAAARVGLIDGDPLRPLLIVYPLGASGVLLTATAVLGLMSAFVTLINEGPAAARKTKRGVQAAAARLKDVLPACRRGLRKVAERRGHPKDVEAYVNRAAPGTTEAARTLGVDEPEANALLAAFGYEKDIFGKWQPGESEEAKALRELREVVWYWIADSDQDAINSFARDHLEREGSRRDRKKRAP